MKGGDDADRGSDRADRVRAAPVHSDEQGGVSYACRGAAGMVWRGKSKGAHGEPAYCHFCYERMVIRCLKAEGELDLLKDPV